ncbi:hypothetical protein Hanom_Chr13g01184181 [Helianthus anomalus]
MQDKSTGFHLDDTTVPVNHDEDQRAHGEPSEVHVCNQGPGIFEKIFPMQKGDAVNIRDYPNGVGVRSPTVHSPFDNNINFLKGKAVGGAKVDDKIGEVFIMGHGNSNKSGLRRPILIPHHRRNKSRVSSPGPNRALKRPRRQLEEDNFCFPLPGNNGDIAHAVRANRDSGFDCSCGSLDLNLKGIFGG